MKISMNPRLLLWAIILLAACTGSAQNSNRLDADEFEKMIRAHPEAPLIDVRTPEEFAGGHIPGAVNANVNENSFITSLAGLDKNSPVFIYCLSGSRTRTAGSKMKKAGFTEVYELEDGFIKWRSLGKATEGGTATGAYSEKDYEKEITSAKTVLVDFYAEWCGPCKKMEPFLKELAEEKAGIVKIIRVDADKAPELTNQLGIQALPTLLLYKDGKLSWSHLGYISKEDLLKQLP